ncbi:MAG: cytochrome c [Phycisphaerales bacterium]|nr:cytochrome c [Phycisphaerales bacterium]
MHTRAAPVVLLIALAAASCSTPATPHAATRAWPAVSDPAAASLPGLVNVVAYHDNFWSGSAPEGAQGFRTLKRMGVRTVISVDGMEPEVALAHEQGLRYIHLPIGYNGMTDARRAELARAARDAMKDGPVYIHCHHGKHRSAGAAAAIAVSLGWDRPGDAVERMKVSGTSPNYKGLYACAATATVLSAAQLDAVPGAFPEVSPPPGFVKGMVEIDQHHDNLKEIEAAGWTTPSGHPDLVPVAEAGRLADLLRYAAGSPAAAAKPADFAAHLLASAELAQAIEDGLPARDAAALSAKFRLLGASCTDCHTKYRD